ncbi:phosphate ABC transporter substrate-binding protein [Agaribacterium sp. ZY112]|uniref:phosphate ABC transporter substrate-binding protein n=1 Tax=Agaribacterium sp. ZY112 TaxID=3233574 RepID=UPI0035262553
MKKLILILGLVGFCASSSAEVAVIVSNSSSISAADVKELERLYLGKTKKIGGVNATPVNQKDGSGAASGFNRAVLNKSNSQIKAYWSKLVFTGKGTPPKELDGDAAVIAEVAGNPNLIGYVDAASVTADVKVLGKF